MTFWLWAYFLVLSNAENLLILRGSPHRGNVPHFGRFRENPSEMGYGNEVSGMRNISSMVQCYRRRHAAGKLLVTYKMETVFCAIVAQITL